MNFAKGVKGTLTRKDILREIDSQSEVELGRHLDSAEKSSLFCLNSPQLVFSKIQQVISIIITYILDYCFLVWIWCVKVFGVSI